MKFRNVDKKSVVLVVISVIIMGFTLAFLNRTNFGTDPCTCMNLGISNALGILLGTWQLGLNAGLLIIVFFFARDQIGWGTLANMTLVGYSFNFFSWCISKWIPDSIFEIMSVRILITIPALAIFIFAAATYMALGLGTAPYDAIPFLIAQKLEKWVSFRVVRIFWDVAACVIGVSLGSVIGVVTLIMAFALGPIITWVKENIIQKIIHIA